jgi:hypothetical protein
VVSSVIFGLKYSKEDFIEGVKKQGIFTCIQSLLDATSKETHLIEDQQIAVMDMSKVKLRFKVTKVKQDIEVEGPR